MKQIHGGRWSVVGGRCLADDVICKFGGGV